MMKKTILYLLAFRLLAGTFAVTAAREINGGAFPKGKKAVLTVLLCLFIAAVPYEVTVLVINTLIHHGMKPLYSICVASFMQSAIVIVSALLTVVLPARRDRKRKLNSAVA